MLAMEERLYAELAHKLLINMIRHHLHGLSKYFDLYSPNSKRRVLSGDFNVAIGEITWNHY